MKHLRFCGSVSALLVGSLAVALGGCSSSSAGSHADSGPGGSSGSSGGSTGSSGSSSGETGSSSGSSGGSGDDSSTEVDATTTSDSGVEPGDSGAEDSSADTGTVTVAPPVDAGPCPTGNPICSATTWAQVNAAHSVPSWVKSTKLGIGMHFMVAAVPADHNEWFYQHEYCDGAFSTWTSTYFPKVSPLSGGPWGYKDFIPLFTCAQWSKPAVAGAATSAASWAALFKASGATYVNATAMHHDRFAMWASDEPASVGGAGTWNAMKMGPKRDVVGELGTAVKALGMKYGVNNHMLYGYSFAYCGTGTTPGSVGPGTPATVSDLYDPRYASLYGPPNPACGKLAADGQCNPDKAFCDDWLYRANELVDKYAIDDEWFDWDGATIAGSPCMVDKLAFVLHYYQTAAARGQQVQIMSKGGVFPNMNDSATGANTALQDFQSSIPSTGPSSPWMVDETISSNGSWCYVDSNGGAPNSTPMAYKSSATVISELDDINGKGGIMMLNISPMPDGTIPQAQIDILNAVGKHLGAQ